jgi:hypothetical protein
MYVPRLDREEDRAKRANEQIHSARDRCKCGKIPAVVGSVPRSAGRFYASGQGAESMIEPEDVSKSDPPQVTELSRTSVDAVNANLVRMHQAATTALNAAEVALLQSAAAEVKADSVSAHQSALAEVKAEEVLAQKTLMGYVEAEKASVSGFTGAVVANFAEVHYGITGVVVGRDVHAQGARTILLVGRNVSGDVMTVLDSRSALIAGLTGGLFAGLLLLLGRVLFRRR